MKCRRCRGDDGKAIEVARDGVVLARDALCDDCLADCMDYMADRRVEFDAMIEAGVDRAEANRIMIARMEGKIATA
jgi:hypothetical protein